MKRILYLVLPITLLFLLTAPFQMVHASFIGDVVQNVKNIFHINGANQTTISSSISLSPNGDLNHNGKIDAGDTITFTYIIKNTTNKSFPFVLLKTNSNSNALNSIHNLKGALSILDKNKTIVIPNIYILSYEQKTISFDATINLYTSADQLISTEPQLITKSDSVLAKAQKNQVIAKKLELAQFNKFVHISK